MRVACGRVSVLFSRRCDTLCTSGFVDDVMFSHNGPYGADDAVGCKLKVTHRVARI